MAHTLPVDARPPVADQPTTAAAVARVLLSGKPAPALVRCLSARTLWKATCEWMYKDVPVLTELVRRMALNQQAADTALWVISILVADLRTRRCAAAAGMFTSAMCTRKLHVTTRAATDAFRTATTDHQREVARACHDTLATGAMLALCITMNAYPGTVTTAEQWEAAICGTRACIMLGVPLDALCSAVFWDPESLFPVDEPQSSLRWNMLRIFSASVVPLYMQRRVRRLDVVVEPLVSDMWISWLSCMPQFHLMREDLRTFAHELDEDAVSVPDECPFFS